MKIDKEHKLNFFQELYASAKSEMESLIQDFEKWNKQYKGSLEIDGSSEDAITVRNITYEPSHPKHFRKTTSATQKAWSSC